MTNFQPRYKRADHLGAPLPNVMEAALAKRGLGGAALAANWREIVGETIDRVARPIQLQWPPRGPRADPEKTGGGTLILRVESAFALQIQYSGPTIIERVNAHLGWACVSRIALRQGPLEARPGRRKPPPAPSEELRRKADAAVAGVEDEELRAALARLGARVFEANAGGEKERDR